ncbi:hypothetical protein JI664_12320 [Rhodobacter sp. NTK016B]|uniref:DUF6473 family protein n=1 Tax=Rhodobacter sp. NTK016B TaxID=2759676 RepID=UPI001A8C550A|nr:DUF6473 family protein [Rhodobacter sp. NTK016B]MBN8292751.1 hypothetical protein [Rhodobacter sp. NTK016B]
MQQCLLDSGGVGGKSTPLAGIVPRAAMPHRALCLIGDGAGGAGSARWTRPLAGRVLDRLSRPAALIEGVDLHLGDPGLVARAQDARAFVLLLPPLGNLSNAFYRVHPRRNDRFIAARAPLRALFPEVDFAPIAFTGHALDTLWATCPERFALVRQELEHAWRARMQQLLALLPPHGVLVDPLSPGWLVRPALTDARGLPRVALGDRQGAVQRICATLGSGGAYRRTQ